MTADERRCRSLTSSGREPRRELMRVLPLEPGGTGSEFSYRSHHTPARGGLTEPIISHSLASLARCASRHAVRPRSLDGEESQPLPSPPPVLVQALSVGGYDDCRVHRDRPGTVPTRHEPSADPRDPAGGVSPRSTRLIITARPRSQFSTSPILSPRSRLFTGHYHPLSPAENWLRLLARFRLDLP